jgi:competence CoiA-like predicted nuclease
MSFHFPMGAINKNTNNYEYPKIADKNNKYICPCCNKNVILRKGKIKQPHFAHYKSNNPCYYYDKPNETQIHKDAKMLIKSLLDNKKNIKFHRVCKYCEKNNFETMCPLNQDILINDYNQNTKTVIEYKFYYNNSNRSADIALLEDDNIKFIFEICYKNKTKEQNRPEPWVEINAEDLINKINTGDNIDVEGNIIIDCIRDYKCENCINYEEKERIKLEHFIKEQEMRDIELLKEKQEILRKEQEEKKRRKEEEEEEKNDKHVNVE